jgi:hypothetical protein
MERSVGVVQIELWWRRLLTFVARRVHNSNNKLIFMYMEYWCGAPLAFFDSADGATYKLRLRVSHFICRRCTGGMRWIAFAAMRIISLNTSRHRTFNER